MTITAKALALLMAHAARGVATVATNANTTTVCALHHAVVDYEDCIGNAGAAQHPDCVHQHNTRSNHTDCERSQHAPTEIHHAHTHQAHSSLMDHGRWFDGARRLRMLIVMIRHTAPNQVYSPSYAGATATNRRAYAEQQIRYIDGEYRHSTYDKLGLNLSHSEATEVNIAYGSIDYDQEDSDQCWNWVWHITQIAFALATNDVNGTDAANFDAILYYLPTDLAQRAWSCYGVAGLCGWPGALADNNPSGSSWYVPRSSYIWKYTCTVLSQPPGHASIASHEFGHMLGLHHAGGAHMRGDAGDPPAHDAPFSEYGDTSATMGNDMHVLNSMTAPARYFLGVINNSAVSTLTDGIVQLRALTKSSDGSDGVFSALALACPQCSPRNLRDVQHQGGELWISLRGDNHTCTNFERDIAHDFRCHRDHELRYNRVHIHLRLNMTAPKTEEWHWLYPHEEWIYTNHSHAQSRIALRVCALDVASDVATLAVGNSRARVQHLCLQYTTIFPSNHPPLHPRAASIAPPPPVPFFHTHDESAHTPTADAPTAGVTTDALLVALIVIVVLLCFVGCALCVWGGAGAGTGTDVSHASSTQRPWLLLERQGGRVVVAYE